MALYGSNGIQDILGYLKTYLAQKFALKADAVDLNSKVDKITGKGLSTNDYTNADKQIVDGVTAALAGKANTSHTHTKSQITDFPSSMPASDVYSWAKASTKPSYTASEVGAAASSHTHSKSQITDFPSSMPASDVYSWAKESSKPGYTWNEISNKPDSFTPSSHTHSKSQITDFPSSMPASDVYSWAKAASKPGYSASEVGAAPANWSFLATIQPDGSYTITNYSQYHEFLIISQELSSDKGWSNIFVADILARTVESLTFFESESNDSSLVTVYISGSNIQVSDGNAGGYEHYIYVR